MYAGLNSNVVINPVKERRAKENYFVPYGINGPWEWVMYYEVLRRKTNGLSLDDLTWLPSKEPESPYNDFLHKAYIPRTRPASDAVGLKLRDHMVVCAERSNPDSDRLIHGKIEVHFAEEIAFSYKMPEKRTGIMFQYEKPSMLLSLVFEASDWTNEERSIPPMQRTQRCQYMPYDYNELEVLNFPDLSRLLLLEKPCINLGMKTSYRLTDDETILIVPNNKNQLTKTLYSSLLFIGVSEECTQYVADKFVSYFC